MTRSNTRDRVSSIAADPALRPYWRLARLQEHDIVGGELDLRRWIVFTEDGRRVGRVHDVLIDIHSLRVSHIEVTLDPRLPSQDSRRVVVPVACARVAANRKHIHLCRVTAIELYHAPRFGARPITESEQDALLAFFVRSEAHCLATTGPATDEALIQARFWGARRRGRELEPYVHRLQRD